VKQARHGPLQRAIASKDLEGVRRAIAEDHPVEPDLDDEESPLGLAVRAGVPDVVAALLAAGARLVPRCRGELPLSIAAELGRLEIARLLVEAGAPLDAHDEDYGTAVHAAAAFGRLDVVRLLLEAGASLDLGEAPILAAAHRGHAEVVELLAPHADARLREMAHAELAAAERRSRRRAGEKRWPRREVERLFDAVNAGDVGAVGGLIDEGLDPNLRDAESGCTPLMAAACNAANGAVVAELVARGADLDLQDHRGETALIGAARSKGAESIVRALAAAGAAVDLADDAGRTPLMHAADAGRAGAARALLDAGADPNLRDPGGVSALTLAVAAGGWQHQKIADILRAAGASEEGARLDELVEAVKRGDVDEVERAVRSGAALDGFDPSGDTALNAAVQRSDERLVRILLEAGADPNRARRNWVELPLDRAVLGAKSEPVARLLVRHGAQLGNRYAIDEPSDGAEPGRVARLLRVLEELGVEVRPPRRGPK
jgi:ankyrin repeat protein